MYRQLHRFDKEEVEWLATKLFETHETRGGALSPVQKVEVTLRYLSDPGFQNSVSKETGIHQSTISKTIATVLPRIAHMSKDWIVFPRTNAQKIRQMRDGLVYSDFRRQSVP